MFSFALVQRICFAVVVVALLGLAAIQPSVAHACSCIAPLGPVESSADAAAVFAGRVVAIEGEAKRPILSREFPFVHMVSMAQAVKVRFDVSTAWKGVTNRQVLVSTATSSAACGFEFTPGSEYIVYAYESQDDVMGPGLATGLCGRTNLLTNAQEDRAVLGAGTVPTGDAIPPSSTSGGPGPLVWSVGAVMLALVAVLLMRRRRVGVRV